MTKLLCTELALKSSFTLRFLLIKTKFLPVNVNPNGTSAYTICARLWQLREFLEQPLCEETFSMKSIIYNNINRFWDGKSFLLRANAAKDMKNVFDADFSESVYKSTYRANPCIHLAVPESRALSGQVIRLVFHKSNRNFFFRIHLPTNFYQTVIGRDLRISKKRLKMQKHMNC